MVFLANENFPMPSIKILRQHDYKVISIAEQYSGISDEEVLNKAVENGWLILTFDSDYGALIFQYQLATPPAIIYFRNKGNSPTWAGETFLNLLEDSDIQFENYFTVIEKDGIRQRKLKSKD